MHSFRTLGISLLLASGIAGPAVAQDVEQEPAIESFAQAGPGSVNTHWFDTGDGIVVIDSQRQNSAASEAIARIESTGRPVTHIIVTHGHPDHYGGLAAFRAAFPDAMLVSSGPTQAYIQSDAGGFNALASQMLGADFTTAFAPDIAVADGQELLLGGVLLRFHIVEDSEAESILLVELPEAQALFASDLIANAMHPFLLEADLAGWNAALLRLGENFEGYDLYPGHGRHGPATALIAAQSAYLDRLARLWRDLHAASGGDCDRMTGEFAARLPALYRGWPDVTGRPDIHALNASAFMEQAEALGLPPCT